MEENSLIRKPRKISKFMTPQAGTYTIAVKIFPVISQSKGNQARFVKSRRRSYMERFL